MFAIRRNAVRSAGRIGAVSARAARTYSTGTHGKTGDQVEHFAGTSTEHGEHHAGPKDESLGVTIPVSIAVYTLAQPSADGSPSSITKMIDSFTYYKERNAERNVLHVNAIEKAAGDRHLFNNSAGARTVSLKFPEVFNTGSPFNVPAGHGSRDMETLVAHYTKLNEEADEKKR
ncbi:hypothetical protein CJF32_00006975 [Rutstroemia sp. NJR-2017a WRK4]|nr:hypothetical protein CJF32_00006975 [Rutstroemia sp. NJR-2017a WRK4]